MNVSHIKAALSELMDSDAAHEAENKLIGALLNDCSLWFLLRDWIQERARIDSKNYSLLCHLSVHGADGTPFDTENLIHNLNVTERMHVTAGEDHIRALASNPATGDEIDELVKVTQQQYELLEAYTHLCMLEELDAEEDLELA